MSDNGCDWDDDWAARVERKIDRLTALLTKEGKTTMTIQTDVANLVAEVTKNTTVTGSVQTLLSQLTTLIGNLKGQVADPATLTALESAITALQANDAAIAAAVTANTPAA